MLQKFFSLSHIVVIALVIVAVFTLICLRWGVFGQGFTLITLSILIAGLGTLGWALSMRQQLRDRHFKQIRQVAERFKAMVRTMPGGYCLFSPQGVFREEFGVANRLCLEKISHFNDIVNAIQEGPELVEHFRAMQKNGTEFSLQVKIPANNFDLQITGRRFRSGKEALVADILWFHDNPVVAARLEIQNVALANAETRMAEAQAMIDALQFPIWARSADLRLVMCNKAYAKAMDVPSEEVLRTQLELKSQTARSGRGKRLAEEALKNNEIRSERRHVVVGGRRRLLEITELPYQQPVPGAESALIGFAIDVTGEEEKETELKRHLVAHHEVMEHLGSAIAIYGPDMRLEFYNRAYQRLWEADESFLHSKPYFSEILEDLRTRRRGPEQADFQRYKKERISLFTSLLEPREDLMHLPDGTSLRILAAPHPFGGLMFVHEDVTDRLALESSYNTLIAVQRETLDNLAEGIAVFGPDGKIRLFNPAFARIWSINAEFLTREPHIAELLEHMKPLFNYGDNWNAFKNDMVGYTLDRTPRTGRLERSDKSIIEFLTVPLPDGAVLNSYLDVTDSVRVEQALRASNAALAAADRLKSEFVANVSYQLRTPLNTITGFADILTNQYFGTLNERQIEYTRTIKEASENLTHLINDVLDLATIEAGRMVLDRQPVAVAELLKTAKQMTSDWARQQGLDIIIDCPKDIGTFEIDLHRMKQVLFNIISNSIKYTPSGGRITLSAEAQGDQIILGVQDTGIGIPEADRDRVFGKFERANPQARQSGAGLGLSLVKSFVDLHGGHIEIAKNVSQGTLITCSIPRQNTLRVNS